MVDALRAGVTTYGTFDRDAPYGDGSTPLKPADELGEDFFKSCFYHRERNSDFVKHMYDMGLLRDINSDKERKHVTKPQPWCKVWRDEVNRCTGMTEDLPDTVTD